MADALPAFCERHGLTAREREVLTLVLEGHDNQNIASEMHLALGTVKSHTHNIFKKTGTKTRQELLQQFWRS
jgi:ATP/maltotriose-dependent transcriptional regulator MalT